jgi:1,4-dihydroxy-6-naphthoate synthase
MRAHAQEHDDAVLMQHVDLYVNEWTVELGPTGERALRELSARAAAIGLGSGRALEIFAG